MIYDSPAFRAIELKHKTVLMAGSPEKKPEHLNMVTGWVLVPSEE